MAYRQPFRSGLKDLAQGLLQQAQAQQQQSQLELQMRQQMIAQETEARKQQSNIFGAAFEKVADINTRFQEQNRELGIRSADMLRKDQQTLTNEIAELKALHDRGVEIPNFDVLMRNVGAYVGRASEILSGDIGKMWPGTNALLDEEVVEGLTGSNILSDFRAQLANARQVETNRQSSGDALAARLENAVGLLTVAEGPGLAVAYNEAQWLLSIINDPQIKDLMPRGYNAQTLGVMARSIISFVDDDPARKRQVEGIIAAGQAEAQGFETDAFNEWRRTGTVVDAYRSAVQTRYEANPALHVRDADGNPITDFNAAEAYLQERTVRLADALAEFDQRAVEFKNAGFDVELVDLAASYAKEGNIAGLDRMLTMPGVDQNFIDTVLDPMRADARKNKDLADLERENVIQAAEFVNQTQAWEHMGLLAATLTPDDFENWWNGLDTAEKEKFGGMPMFNAMMRDSRLLDLTRDNEVLNTALARVLPLVNSPTPPDPESVASLSAIIANELTKALGPGYEEWIDNYVTGVQVAWADEDTDRRMNLLREQNMQLQNQLVGTQIAEAVFSMNNPSPVDTKELRLWMDSTRAGIKDRLSAVEAQMTQSGCVVRYTTDDLGLGTRTTVVQSVEQDTLDTCRGFAQQYDDIQSEYAELNNQYRAIIYGHTFGNPSQRLNFWSNEDQKYWTDMANLHLETDYPNGLPDTLAYAEDILAALEQTYAMPRHELRAIANAITMEAFRNWELTVSLSDNPESTLARDTTQRVGLPGLVQGVGEGAAAIAEATGNIAGTAAGNFANWVFGIPQGQSSFPQGVADTAARTGLRILGVPGVFFRSVEDEE